ncbi:hypothetical protein ACIBBD_27265 [Streptomyces sp. NPDC051315]|uniref:hypothetical protein n=1 Tax=Streptomyces sp. NPDC051315 TaxID=3365650 RepID=UPI00379AA091
MGHHLPAERGPGTPPGTGEDGTGVARLPVSNAIAAVIIAVAALLGAVAVLLLMPGTLEALGTAVTISGSGFTLAARIAVPR